MLPANSCQHENITHEIFHFEKPIHELGYLGTLAHCTGCHEPLHILWIEKDGQYVQRNRIIPDNEKATILLLGYSLDYPSSIVTFSGIEITPEGKSFNLAKGESSVGRKDHGREQQPGNS
jgi:hypothetical protein